MRLNLTRHTAAPAQIMVGVFDLIRFLAQACLAAAIIGAPMAYYFIFVMTP